MRQEEEAELLDSMMMMMIVVMQMKPKSLKLLKSRQMRQLAAGRHMELAVRYRPLEWVANADGKPFAWPAIQTRKFARNADGYLA